MTIRETKDFLYGLVSGFFNEATVRWAKTKGVTPMPPFVTISCNYVSRNTYPIINEDGNRCYNYSMRFEVNVYTEGAAVDDGTGSDSHVYENTAMYDLEQFIRYIDSTQGLKELQNAGVSIMLDGQINDLSELTGDTRFNYRARAEFAVSFVGTAAGEYALYGETLPDSSGGGTETHAETDDYTIASVEIEANDNSSNSTFASDDGNIISVDSEEE